MNGQTSVTAVGVAGAVTTLCVWLLGYFAPGFWNAAPPGAEAAFTTIFTFGIVYVTPAFKIRVRTEQEQ